MSSTHRLVIACLSLLLAAAPAAPADPAGDKAAPRKDNPLDPLNAVDPFVGAFEDNQITIVVRRAQDGYVGEVEKGGQTFSFKGVRKGDSLRGTFEFDGEAFDFVLTLSGDTVTFATPRKLSRKKDGVRATPGPPAVPAIPSPAANPGTPKSPPVAPSAALPLPPSPSPIKTGEKAATASAWALKPLEKDAGAEAGRTWAGFPVGTFAVVETVTSLADQIPKEERALLVFKGAAGGKEVIQRFQFDGSLLKSEDKLVEWLGPGRSMETLGFAAGKTSVQDWQVQGVTLKCDVTEYTPRTPANQKNRPLGYEVWTSAGVNLPPHLLALSQGSLLVGANVVRIVSLPDETSKNRVDFRLTALKQPLSIGAREINTAVYKSTYIAGNDEITIERHQSAQVPGGTARFVVERRQESNLIETATVTVVETGIANVDALTGPRR